MIEGTVLNGKLCDVVFPFYTGKAGLAGDGLSLSYRGTVTRGTVAADGTVDGETARAVSVLPSAMTKGFVVVRLATAIQLPAD